MAMEYISGETLKRILEPPSIPLSKRLAMIEELCAGLAHAHSAEIVHRDIKPENIMLDGDGGKFRVPGSEFRVRRFQFYVPGSAFTFQLGTENLNCRRGTQNCEP